MAFRIHPLWWPLLAGASPAVIPAMAVKRKRFLHNAATAAQFNQERIQRTRLLDLPDLEKLSLTVLVEEKAEDGFLGDAGVSYLFSTDRGRLLYDLGFGPERPALSHNAVRLGFHLQHADEMVISHLHPDHMGGMKAVSAGKVAIPEIMGSPSGQSCYFPDCAGAPGFNEQIVQEPAVFSSGLGTTGPLARSLFFMGLTEEQAIVGHVKDKGLVVFTGCGHPTAEVILEMVRRLSDQPLYAFGGGLHFPVTGGRGNRLGIQLQQVIGTGKPPWQRINDEDLSGTIGAINRAAPAKVYLSAHDTCDYAIERLQNELSAETTVLKAGGTYLI